MGAAIYASKTFIVAYYALPDVLQKKIEDSMPLFAEDPTLPRFHVEPVEGTQNFYSARIEQNLQYRIIMTREMETNTFLFHYVDKHAAAYDWACRRRVGVNQKTGVIQLFRIPDAAPAPAPAPAEPDRPPLFAQIGNKDLLALGVPEELLPLIRSIRSPEQLQAEKLRFPEDTFEALTFLTEGFALEEVLKLYGTHQPAGTLQEAMQLPENQSQFVRIDSETGLRPLFEGPLEKWRVFLHPIQRALVNKDYAGPARATGAAGTGKTVVAMHRAKRLAAGLKGNEKLLFTTYTANLVQDIQQNLRSICTDDEFKRIEVVNLDKLAKDLLSSYVPGLKLDYDEKNQLKSLWETAAAAEPDLDFGADFYAEEYRIATAQETFSEACYLAAPREGRRIRLDRAQRSRVWRVFEAYRALMDEQNLRDIDTVMYECRMQLAAHPEDRRYRHVIVDEGQDFGENAFRLLRALAGEQHENDLFIVGDTHQRIYQSRVSLSRCGIDVRGRGSMLIINYRTTAEIQKAAMSLLKGDSFDDLDDGEDSGRSISLTHGLAPELCVCGSDDEEFEAIRSRITALIESGVEEKDICVVARTHKLLDAYMKRFGDNDIRCFEIKKSKSEERMMEGVRVATMHRVKGLEFQYVFIVGAGRNVIPPRGNAAAGVEREEKCLLYVAMTRAQKGVFISSSGPISKFFGKEQAPYFR